MRWLRALLTAPLKRRAERRFAGRVCAESLAALQVVRATQANLQGDALYEAVVASRTKLDATRARAVVLRAHESLEGWGNDREAKLIDVVQYMIVSEYLSQNAGNEGMIIDIGALLKPRIDPRL
jgi:predicted methyltransferase